MPTNERNSLFTEKSSNKQAKTAYRYIFGYTSTENYEKESLFYREIFRSRYIIYSRTRHTIALPKF